MGDQSNLVRELCDKYKYSPYMIERYVDLFGEERIKKFLDGNEQKILTTIKVNTLRITKDALFRRLNAKGFELEPISVVPDAFYVKKEPFSIGATTEYLLGYYYIQSLSSMIPSLALNVSSHDIVVDMCAAPGGKTIHLAQLMKNQGVILAFELNRERMRSFRSNISRCGAQNIIVFRTDAANLPDLHIKGISKILLDAPCTGSGLIPVDPSRKTSRSFEDIKFCSNIQMKLITAAVEALERGGELVYSTCSIEPEENEYIINSALQQFRLEVVDLNIDYGEPGLINVFSLELSPELKKARRIYPYLHKTEGFFVCKLKKV